MIWGLLRQAFNGDVHEALNHGDRPAFTLQLLSDLIDLIGNLLSHQLLKQVVGVLGGCGHGKRDLLRD